jgi:hypothetical protein
MSESILHGKVIEPNAAYHASAPISKSRLARIGVSPAWFKWCEENKQEQTESMKFGSAFHKFVLEPKDFDNEFAIAPVISIPARPSFQLDLAFLFLIIACLIDF